jgi:hypothetical protein
MFIARVADGTAATCHKRVDGDTLSREWAGGSETHRFMPQYQRRNASLIMPMPGMHIRPAYAAKFKLNYALAFICDRQLDILYL